MFALFNFIISLVVNFIDATIGTAPALGGIYSLAVFLPALALSIRRLHDIGRTGWWMLIAFVPLIGFLVLLVFFILDSQPGSNDHGANPKGL